MAFCTPTVETRDKCHVRTKAYAVETEKSNGIEMVRLLKTAFKESGEFIPFQMRTKHPEAFVKAIQIQTQKMSSNRTIEFNHVGTDAMLYLSHWIENIEGVKDIIPYRSVERDGRFRILVEKTDFNRIRNLLISNLKKWFEDHVAPDAHPPFGRYPGDPEVAPIFSDRFSSGDASYMATSVNTIMMYDETWLNDANNQASESPNTDCTSQTPLGSHEQSSQALRNANARTTPLIPTPFNNIAEKLRQDTDTIKADLDRRSTEVEVLKEEIRSLKDERRSSKAGPISDSRTS